MFKIWLHLAIGFYSKEKKKVFYTDNCPAENYRTFSRQKHHIFYHPQIFTKLFQGRSHAALLEKLSLMSWWLLTKRCGICLAIGQDFTPILTRGKSQSNGRNTTGVVNTRHTERQHFPCFYGSRGVPRHFSSEGAAPRREDGDRSSHCF